MKLETKIRDRIIRNALLSVLIYALPVVLMLLVFRLTGQRPWAGPLDRSAPPFGQLFRNFGTFGLPAMILALGIVEFSFGLYDHRWNRNEKFLDLVCFAIPDLLTKPLIAYYGLKVLPVILPELKNSFEWVPFGWGFLIICVGDDLTQYWYHRLHHEIPWLWRFHRTHHSAPYMGMSMANRQNLWFTVFFSQTYVTTALVYLGLGPSAVVVLAIKSIITTLAHSSIPWDKPFYRYKVLHPAAWVLERLISTPATHHAHHAASSDDGVGFYKGNFGNMFFLWDVIFGTGIITRRYPVSYGVSHYEGDPWYAQFLWPILKSNVPGSELAPDGPMVKEDAPNVDYVERSEPIEAAVN